jgi:hypothetical protein
MRRGLRLAGLLLLCASAMPLMACNVGNVNVYIPGFDTSAVEGVSFWRDESGAFVFDGTVVFAAPVVNANGQEVVDYEMRTPSGTQMLAGRAHIYRDSAIPDNVSVRVYYMRVQQVSRDYKVSTYNAVGDSMLSADAIRF